MFFSLYSFGGEGWGEEAPLSSQIAFGRRNLIGLRWHKSVIFCFAHDLNASGSTMQRTPYLKQYSVAIGPPLMIPKSQLFDSMLCKEVRAFSVVSHLHRHPVHKAIQFDCKLRRYAIEIQMVWPDWMLPAKFESSETSGS